MQNIRKPLWRNELRIAIPLDYPPARAPRTWPFGEPLRPVRPGDGRRHRLPPGLPWRVPSHAALPRGLAFPPPPAEPFSWLSHSAPTRRACSSLNHAESLPMIPALARGAWALLPRPWVKHGAGASVPAWQGRYCVAKHQRLRSCRANRLDANAQIMRES